MSQKISLIPMFNTVDKNGSFGICMLRSIKNSEKGKMKGGRVFENRI